MEILKDVLTNKEVGTTALKLVKITPEADKNWYCIQGRQMTVDGTIVLAGANPSAEDEAEIGGDDSETVVDVIHNHSLFKVADSSSLTRKEFKKIWQSYLKHLISKLDADKKKEMKANFKAIDDFAKATFYGSAAKGHYDELEFYVPDGCCLDGESMLIPARWLDGQTAPAFYYLKSGLELEKC